MTGRQRGEVFDHGFDPNFKEHFNTDPALNYTPPKPKGMYTDRCHTCKPHAHTAATCHSKTKQQKEESIFMALEIEIPDVPEAPKDPVPSPLMAIGQRLRQTIQAVVSPLSPSHRRQVVTPPAPDEVVPPPLNDEPSHFEDSDGSIPLLDSDEELQQEPQSVHIPPAQDAQQAASPRFFSQSPRHISVETVQEGEEEDGIESIPDIPELAPRHQPEAENFIDTAIPIGDQISGT